MSDFSSDRESPGANKRSSPVSSGLSDAKRARTSGGEEPRPQPKGQVLKVRMHNFMTYSDATIVPGPRLNLVLGPNGTGKSSLVNALCMGLAGNPNLLGRADNVRDFVRKGTDKGYTEITLSSDTTRPITIKRQMNAKDNSSIWLINGAEVTKTKVLETVASLKIQVDNLCQFLPQDKVVMFARLTPTELLKETEKSIGGGELFELHKQLTAKKAAQNDASQSAAVLQAELDRHRAANVGQERDVERFQKREELLEKVEALERKLPWVRYADQKKGYLEIKENKQNQERLLQAKQDELAAQQGPLREQVNQRSSADLLRRKTLTAIREAETATQKHYDEANELSERMEEEQDAINNLEEDVAAHEHRLVEGEAKVAAAQAKIEALPAPPAKDNTRENALRREVVTLQAKERSSRTEADAKGEEASSAQREVQRLQNRLRQLDSLKGRRLAELEQRNPGITDAHKWVTANQASFRGRVYGPVILEVQAANPVHAAMLEQHVPMAQWLVFVTEHKEDQDQLIRVSRDQNWRFKPSVSCYNGNASAPIPHPKGDASRFREFGIEATLDEVFDAPLLVKHNLKDEASIHEAYIGGTDSTEHVASFLNGSRGVTLLWTPDSQYRVNTSAYNANARSQLVIPLRPARFLKNSSSASGAERADLEAQIKAKEEELEQLLAERNAADAAAREASEAVEKVRAEAKALSDARVKHEKKVRDLENRLKADKRALERLRAAPSPRDQEPQLRAKLDATTAQAVASTAQAVLSVKKMWEGQKAEAHLTLATQQLDLMVKALQKVTDGQERALANSKRRLAQLDQLLEEEKEQLRTKLRVAEDKTGPLNAELKAEWATVQGYGETAAEIVASLTSLQAEADEIVCANPRVMEEYRERQAAITALDGKLRDQMALLETRQAELQRIEGEWLPQLQRIVGKVNRTFRRSFAKIGCAGEVALVTDPDDYDRYAIAIKVKFREAEELQVLNAQRQSGGERSVSTILYLVALQGVAACPFRVVDEINQGMDPHNERKVFKELVSAATDEGTPQCFLLTPKLLPDLPFTANVNVLQIMNGPHLSNIALRFDQDSIIGKRQIAAH